MHGYMLKLGNPFLTQWQRRYFYLFPNRVEWRGEGESRVSVFERFVCCYHLYKGLKGIFLRMSMPVCPYAVGTLD